MIPGLRWNGRTAGRNTGALKQVRITVRGWGFVAAALAAVLAAQILGRRDLLHAAVLLLSLPLISVLTLWLARHRFSVDRRFQPQVLPVGSTTTVALHVAASSPRGAATILEETLPELLGRTALPAPHRTGAGSGPEDRYEYLLRPPCRVVYDIGPVTARFTDPFGLAIVRRILDTSDILVVTPTAVDLPRLTLAGAWNGDGPTALLRQAGPGGAGVMTRGYRNGDPMHRVHWASTARRGALMVREEEQEAPTAVVTLVMDQRCDGFGPVTGAGRLTRPPGSTPAFEWALTAVMSISAHLLERNHRLRLLDQHGAPALLRSSSAPNPAAEDHHGPDALMNIAEGLAGLEPVPANDDGPGDPRTPDRTTGRTRDRVATRGSKAVPPFGAAPTPFGEWLRTPPAPGRGGPMIAVLGALTPEDALRLAAASGAYSWACAIIVAERPEDFQVQLESLNAAGWRACAVSPSADLALVWPGLDLPLNGSGTTGKNTAATKGPA